MAKKHAEILSSRVMRGRQIKPTMRYHLFLRRMASVETKHKQMTAVKPENDKCYWNLEKIGIHAQHGGTCL